ncbi:MAG TPA: L,D-transpeptidase [Terracidiphilus sp.]|nr:L,D-transpeptidase [Terracidiphilus sp.]
MKLTNWAAIAVTAMGLVAPAAAQSAAKRVIVISLEDRKLALIEDGQVTKVYPVAVGKPSTPSPVGTFTIERRVANPVYHHDGKTVQPGPGNPVGTRWMGLSIKGYGIHGTNAPKSIGNAASHGCIRMARPDLEELFAMVSVGDTVELIGERNDETAQLFGTSEGAAAPAQPALTAQATPLAAPALPVTTDLLSALSSDQPAPAFAVSAGGSR